MVASSLSQDTRRLLGMVDYAANSGRIYDPIVDDVTRKAVLEAFGFRGKQHCSRLKLHVTTWRPTHAHGLIPAPGSSSLRGRELFM